MLTIKKNNYVDLQSKVGINSWDAFVLYSNPFNFGVSQLLASAWNITFLDYFVLNFALIPTYTKN